MNYSNSREAQINFEEAVFLHSLAIEMSGGKDGLREKGLLEGALGRPWSGMKGVLFYNSPFRRAGALMEAIIRDHPFVDGNKRTGFLLAGYSLYKEGFDLSAENRQIVSFVVGLAEKRISQEDMVGWIVHNCKTTIKKKQNTLES